jgi:hypothetical protein
MPVTYTEIADPFGDTGSFDSRMVFGDFDNDGDLDVLFQDGSTAGAGIGYFRNDNGTFVRFNDATTAGLPFEGVNFTTAQISPTQVFVVDVDGDGDDDIVSRVSADLAVYINDNGSFSRQADPFGDTGSFDSRMVFGDFDNDGDLDALFQNGNTAGVGIGYFRNDGGTFVRFNDATTAGLPFEGVDFTNAQISPNSVTVVDYDDDGDDDILSRESGDLALYRNDNGTMTLQADPLGDTGGFDSRMIFGDFDSDGDIDILFQDGNTAGAGIGYFRNDNGTFVRFNDAATAGLPFAGFDFTGFQVSPTQVFVADIDNDGDADIVSRDGANLTVLRQNDSPPTISASTPADGGTDVAVGANIVLTFDESVTKGAGNIYLYRGDGVLIETISVGSAQVTGSGTTWTIDPSVTLAASTNYYILIDDETFVDGDGAVFMGLYDPTDLNFNTAAAAPSPTPGDDELTGTAGADTIDGLGGKDVIEGLGGDDVLDGGDSQDRLYGGDGNDELYAGAGNDNLWGGDGDDELFGETGANKLFGEAGDDILTGGTGNDRLDGGADNDTLTGGGGNDYLDGGTGVNSLSGGTGNDVYMVRSINDTVTENVGEGIDLVRTTISLTLGANVENGELLSIQDLNLIGNELVNNLTGNVGENTLSGLAGNDTLNGGDGDDILIGGLGKDTLIGGLGADTFTYLQESIGLGGSELDNIVDFSTAEGDRFDFSAIDANSVDGGDQAFVLAENGFTRTAGEMFVFYVAGQDQTVIRLDVDGDGLADLQLRVGGDVTGDTAGWLL